MPDPSPPSPAKIWLLAAALLAALGAGAYLGISRWLRPVETVVAPVDPGKAIAREALPVPAVRFTDVTEKAGIRFRHSTGASGNKLLPETMGAGIAVLDYDNDGKPDLLFVNSRPWPGEETAGAALPTLALCRNRGDGTFADVTAEAGLGVSLYGMGVAVGDYDNDGWPDLFVTGVGGNHLFHNEPNGAGARRFRDVTAEAGVGGPGGWADARPGEFIKREKPLTFSTSATFVDYDGDGRLDLFVCNYVTWSPDLDMRLGSSLVGVGRTYGQPTSFEGAVCFLYRNVGGGKFKDVSAEAGVQVFEREGTDKDARMRPVGKSLGVIACDPDEDGWPDLVVANDSVRNFFFHNVPGPDGGRRFEEIGMISNVAYAEGRARGAMGIDYAPGYRPGRSALAVGNFANEPDTFLCLEDPKRLLFNDQALAEGVAGPSRSLLKFGLLFLDYDNDGRPDLLTCNGHLDPDIGKVQRGQSYAQPAQLFWNAGRQPRGFEPVAAKDAGQDLFKPLVGRGCAYLDFDGDGALDVVLTANGGPARLLRNEGGTGNHWIRFRLEGDGKRSNRSAIGARVKLEAGGAVQWREVAGARGYLSQSDLAAPFGLGKTDKVDRVTIYWPGREAGPPQVIEGPAVDREHRIRQAP